MKSLFSTHTLSFVTIGIIIFLILCPLPVMAIKVGGSIYSGNIAPGSTTVHTMTISTNPGDAPMDLTVDVLGLGQSLQQSNTGLSPEKDTSPYSARTFITVSPQTFHLDPGKSQEVKATITVPQNAGDGGRYAIISIHNAPTGTGSTLIVTGISVPVVITLTGTATNMKGAITDVAVADVIPGQPIKITTSLKNTGNYHFKVKNNVSITDSTGKIIVEGGSGISSRSIVPPFTGEYEVNLAAPLPMGTYTITSVVSLADGTILDSKTKPLEIKNAYIAPMDETTITLSPKSPATLTSTDGRVVVSFPAGAVFSDVNVTLKPISNDKLPAAPKGAKLGATSFRVDGLTGLLSKDATVLVKYSSADLDAAGSDVSKLTLARYDDSDNKWTILPTTLDKGSLTLSSATNRFGIMAVMVSSGGNTQGGTQGSASSTTGASKPGIGLDSTIVFVALGLMIVFVGIHRSRKH
jgi:P pilus assembly chaperone PapD